jgi:DNA-binding response OmpR family regulator
MNRRVLLIDADPSFQDTLTHQLRRYQGMVVVPEPNPEAALALAQVDPPVLLVIGVEEPEKAGFRLFQKCKKGPTSKIPVLLVTASVTPESFAKHRGLKVHADEYIDKRTVTVDELVGKIDNLIGLGEPLEEDIAIPV